MYKRTTAIAASALMLAQLVPYNVFAEPATVPPTSAHPTALQMMREAAPTPERITITLTTRSLKATVIPRVISAVVLATSSAGGIFLQK